MTTKITLRGIDDEGARRDWDVPCLIAECTVCGMFGVFHPVAEEDLARAWTCRDYWCLKMRAEIAARCAAERERDALADNLTAVQARCTELLEKLRALRAATIIPADASDAEDG